MKKCPLIAIVAATALTSTVQAGSVDISFENIQGEGGLFFTPAWVGVHNGGFDTYSGGQPSSDFPGLEELAEDGNNAPFAARFAASAASIAGGVDATFGATTVGPPPFNPGETGSLQLDTGDTTVNRYFSYASMLIPTNDLFASNGNPLAHEIYDTEGNFTGPVTIEIFARDLIDNGTEVNDINAGAAFSANGGVGIDEGGLIDQVEIDDILTYLNTINGTQTVSGDTINTTVTADTLLARITITDASGPAAVPTPSALVAGLGLMGATLLRRRRA